MSNTKLVIKTVEGDDEINRHLNEDWKIVSASTYYVPFSEHAVSGALMSKIVKPSRLLTGKHKRYAK